jgi:hypothetical protein
LSTIPGASSTHSGRVKILREVDVTVGVCGRRGYRYLVVVVVEDRMWAEDLEVERLSSSRAVAYPVDRALHDRTI